MTPGHPERGDTPGVEVTTGPLGQGFANGVGMAIAEAFLAARYNRPGHEIIDHYTYGIVSDGDIMEGVAMEAASLAGHLELGKLIYLYDQNQITLAGTANLSSREDVAARFEALGWHTVAIDGMDTDAVRAALDEARGDHRQAVADPGADDHRLRLAEEGRTPSASTARRSGRTRSPRPRRTSAGRPNRPSTSPTRRWTYFREAIDRGAERAGRLADARFDAYADGSSRPRPPSSRARMAGELPDGWDADLPTWNVGDKPIATRKASEAVDRRLLPEDPDLHRRLGRPQSLDQHRHEGRRRFRSRRAREPSGVQGALGGGWGYAGRNIHFGIREHAMGSAVNGMAAHGGVHPLRRDLPRLLRLHAARRSASPRSPTCKSIFVFTHDSIAVGEDGPTHEPVEHVMSLRLIPNLTVIRPADANETAEAWKVALTSTTARPR